MSPINLTSSKSSDSVKTSPEQHAKNRRKKKPTKVSTTTTTKTAEGALNTSSDFNSDFSSSPITTPPAVNSQVSTLVNNDAMEKFDSDGCETIDKIAQMVSSITQSTLPAKPALAPHPFPPPIQEPSINDVENRLEQMFAETSDPVKETTAPPQSAPVDVKEPEIKEDVKSSEAVVAPPKPKKPRKKKPNEAGGSKKKSKKAGANDAKSKGGKGEKNSKVKGNDKKEKGDQKKSAKSKENGGRSRVKNDVAPFLNIQKDGSFQIINQIVNGDEDAEKLTSKPKKLTTEKHKNIRGLHVSTLSNKYDAEKRDTSWICVFCKLEPHKFKLGDLFGPYIIDTTSPEYALCLEDPVKDIFRQGNANKFLPISRPPPLTLSPAKKKRKTSEGKLTSPQPSTSTSTEVSTEVFTGMTKIDEKHYEIWFHEDCLVHAPGTYIIGSKINGLEAAVWQCTRHNCTSCGKNGAMMACLFRGCKKEAHFVCAKKTWKLTDDFKYYCELHSA